MEKVQKVRKRKWINNIYWFMNKIFMYLNNENGKVEIIKEKASEEIRIPSMVCFKKTEKC